MNTHSHDTDAIWVILAGNSHTMMVASSLSMAKDKYITALKLSNEELIKQAGYFPGSYATDNIMGKHEADRRSFSPWTMTNDDFTYTKLDYTHENLDKLMMVDPIYNYPLITFKMIPLDEMVFTSHLDG